MQKNCVSFAVLLTFCFFWCIISGMEKYGHIKNFEVGFCDVDFKDELKPSALLAYFEEAACSSAEELGFGYRFCKPNGYAFMVTEIKCEFFRPIPLGECVEVETWPLPPSYVVFNREYELRAKSGETLVLATSRWCMSDVKSGKILSSKVLQNQDYATYRTDRALEDSAKIPKFSMEEGELGFEMTVANSEYDHNMHVNNTRYADYCFNCFSVAELSKKRLKRFSIAYVKQCKEGERLRFFKKQDGENVLVCGFNGANVLVVRSEIRFE